KRPRSCSVKRRFSMLTSLTIRVNGYWTCLC
ncbi:hypothetical protein D046_0091B, partial [Vibrio parahaemolyticus V-223/04]